MLWGMGSALGSDADGYLRPLHELRFGARHRRQRRFWHCLLDANGDWVNAVDRNTGGTKKFVAGPWQSSYGLGTYGIDTGFENRLGGD